MPSAILLIRNAALLNVDQRKLGKYAEKRLECVILMTNVMVSVLIVHKMPDNLICLNVISPVRT